MYEHMTNQQLRDHIRENLKQLRTKIEALERDTQDLARETEIAKRNKQRLDTASKK
jgi:outer membrane murein-binding lipoprotein Lpp